MKATLLFIIGTAALGLSGCESDLPPDERLKVGYTSEYRDDVYSRQAPPATDLERTPW